MYILTCTDTYYNYLYRYGVLYSFIMMKYPDETFATAWQTLTNYEFMHLRINA